MVTKKHHVLNVPSAAMTPLMPASTGAMGLALCAGMTAGLAQAAPIAVISTVRPETEPLVN